MEETLPKQSKGEISQEYFAKAKKKINNGYHKFQLTRNQEIFDLLFTKRPDVRILNFKWDWREDELPEKLLNAMKLMKKVHTVNMTLSNETTDYDMHIFGEYFKRLHCLQSINLDLTQLDMDEITDEGLSHLFENLKIPSLRALKINFKCLSSIVDDQVISSLSKVLKRLYSLRSIDLNFEDCGEITDCSLCSLGQSFEKIRSLQSINLNFEHCCKITNQGVSFLGEGLKKLRSLRSIKLDFLRCFSIDDQALRHLADGLKNCALQAINLSFSHCHRITDRGLGFLSECIRTNSLISINLNFVFSHLISDQGIRTLAEDLKRLTTLQSIGLNFFSGARKESNEDFHPIIGVLERNTSLQSLYLNFEGWINIGQIFLKNLRECLQKLSLLRSITIDFGDWNRMGDQDLADLGECFQRLNLLRSINLTVTYEHLERIESLHSIVLGFGHYCRNVTGQYMREFFEELKKKKSLRKFYLSSDFHQMNKYYDL